jgi:hypothetical protein
MNEFMLLFRYSSFEINQMSPQEFEALTNKWKEWIGKLMAQGALITTGSRLTHEGKVVKPDGVIIDGPFVEIKERLGGFLILKAHNLDEATALAHGCPTLDMQGSVEIRPILQV